MIALAEAALRERRRDIASMIQPFVPRRPGIEVRQIGGGSDFVVAVISKGVAPKTVETPDAVRIPTVRAGVFLNYHERWKPIVKSKDFHLERAYFHLYVAQGSEVNDTQILCFHCEPSAGAVGPSAAYKNGPHLHVGGGTPNIMKSHIAVCIGDPKLGGDDIASLSQTLKEALKMIYLELLPKY